MNIVAQTRSKMLSLDEVSRIANRHGIPAEGQSREEGAIELRFPYADPAVGSVAVTHRHGAGSTGWTVDFVTPFGPIISPPQAAELANTLKRAAALADELNGPADLEIRSTRFYARSDDFAHHNLVNYDVSLRGKPMTWDCWTLWCDQELADHPAPGDHWIENDGGLITSYRNAGRYEFLRHVERDGKNFAQLRRLA